MPGVDGRNYAGYGLVPSMLAVPGYLVGHQAATALHRDEQIVAGLTITLSASLLAALVPVLLALWLWIIGFSWFPAASSAMVLAFASPFWHYGTKWFSSEPPFALFLMASTCLLALPTSPIWIATSGLLFGLACACRVYGVIMAPVFLLYGWLLWRQRGNSGKQIVKATLSFCASSGCILALIALSNWMRFGSILKTGYQLQFPTTSILLSTPLWTGARGLLVNGEVGFLFFVPWALALPFVLKPFYRKFPAETIFILSLAAVNFLFFSKYSAWHGGTAIGPRMLLILVPYLIPPLAMLVEGSWRPGAFVMALATASVVLALAIQVVMLPFPGNRYYVLRGYDDAHGSTAWWNHRLILKATVDLPTLFSPNIDLHPADPGEQSLLTMQNNVNLLRPDLWMIKAAIFGAPASALAVLALLLGLTCWFSLRCVFNRA